MALFALMLLFRRRLKNYDSAAGFLELFVAHNTKRAPKRSKVQASKPSLAFGGAVHASIRNRWQSERPFLGHSESSLIRKLRSDAVLDYTKDLIYKELCSRGVIEIDATTGRPNHRSQVKLSA